MKANSNNSPAGRAISAGPPRRYLLGYVAGMDLARTEFLLGQKLGLSHEASIAGPKLFKTRRLAEIAGRMACMEYTRAYCYSTNNPANAVGLTPIEQCDDTGLKPIQ